MSVYMIDADDEEWRKEWVQQTIVQLVSGEIDVITFPDRSVQAPVPAAVAASVSTAVPTATVAASASASVPVPAAAAGQHADVIK
ncbi:unnamed protein product [Tilletia controversa]|nr:unnamed protein product [Tilletia controversa]CAD7062719.1 unnamed protein product [Tilletia caries]